MGKQILYFLLSLFLPLAVFSEGECYIDNQEVIVQDVRALIISGDEYCPPDYVLKTTKGVLFYRIAMPVSMSDQVRFGKHLQQQIMGRPLTFAALNGYKKEIADYYLKYCNMHVAVVLPEQDCSHGIIVLKIIPSKLGDVTVTGNYWFPKEHYLKYMNQDCNEILNSDKVVATLNKINSSPWTKAEAVYKAGKNPGQTDVELIVEDKKPMQFYAGADNTGFRITQYSRLYIGFNWGNIFDLDQTLAFCYTASPDFTGFQSFVADYRLPLPNEDGLRFSAGYAHVEAGDDVVPLGIRQGNSWQLSGRYDLQLPQTLSMHQKFNFGMDFKRTNNDFNVGETTIASLYAAIFQFAADYEGGLMRLPHHVTGNVGVFAQPWQLGDAITKKAYFGLRPYSNPYYIYSRGHVKYQYYSGKQEDFFCHSSSVGTAIIFCSYSN